MTKNKVLSWTSVTSFEENFSTIEQYNMTKLLYNYIGK